MLSGVWPHQQLLSLPGPGHSNLPHTHTDTQACSQYAHLPTPRNLSSLRVCDMGECRQREEYSLQGEQIHAPMCTHTHTNHVHAHKSCVHTHTHHVYTHTHTEIFCLKAVAPQQSILWGDSHLPGQLEDLRSNRSGAGLFSGLGKLGNPLPLTLVCLLGLASTGAGLSHPRTMLPEREEWVAPTNLLSY